MDATNKDYWPRVTTIEACHAALVAYEGDAAVSALAHQRLAELTTQTHSIEAEEALINHIKHPASPLTYEVILKHLETLMGSRDRVDSLRGTFWELGGKKSLPGGADWVNANLAHPDSRQTLAETIAIHHPSRQILNVLLSFEADINPQAMKRTISHLGKEASSRIFTEMYRAHQTVPSTGFWEDEHLGKLAYRDTLISLIYTAPAPAPAGAGGGGAGAAAGVVAFSPPAPGRGTRLAAVGMVNEGGTDCYLVTAWQLLLNIPRLRNQILKHLRPHYIEDGLNVDLTRLKPLAGEHLRAKAAGTTTPLKGSSEIRPILTALGTTSSSERRIKDSGEIIYDLVKAMSRESSFLPKFKITQHMPMGGGSFSIETPDSQGPLRISPSAHSFIEGMINSLGYHPNVAPRAGEPIASTTQIIGPPPLDLFVSVNRRNLDPIRVDEAYRLPIEATTERGPSDYTLQGFAYWTGGHYISFYKNLDHSWTMVNDSVASTPSLDTLTHYRERASLIYYQRNDAPSLDTDEDNAWWRVPSPAPVVGTAGTGGACSLM